MSAARFLGDLPTPALVVDVGRLSANIEAMAERAVRLGVALRPHIKTHKCLEIAAMQRDAGARGLTVSTLEEARTFIDAGFDDIVWAFPLIAGRIDEAGELARRVRFGVVVDSPEAIDVLETGAGVEEVWLKVDCGYHRAGVDPRGEAALALPSRLERSPKLRLAGLLSHSGNAYDTNDPAQRRAIAEEERSLMVELRERLSSASISVPILSIGSTPSMTSVETLEGVDEARPGNYVYFDTTQIALGSCTAASCALSVVSSVVSARAGARRSIVDAGGLALSKEPPHPLAPRPSMGEIFADEEGAAFCDHRLVSLSQEHGIVDAPLPVGERIRIVPNHSCMASACFDDLWVAEGDRVVDRWRVHRGR